MSEGDLRSQVRHAVIWRAGVQILQQALQWSLTLVVIRLLLPEDYGLIAMAEVVTSFINLLAVEGLTMALVQAAQISDRQVRQFFGLMIITSLSLAALQLLVAPLAGDFYRSRPVQDILSVQSILYLFLPFITIPTALASRRMAFKGQALVHFCAMLGSGATVLTMAWSGYGAWSLVGGTIALAAIRAAGMTIGMRWLVWPSFDFTGMGAMLRFGTAATLNGVIWLFYTQADVLIAGRSLEPHQIGLYSEALFLAALPVSKFIPALNEVGLAAYARIQDDKVAIRWNLLRAAGIVSAVTFPIFFGLAATAHLFVPVIMGKQWLEAVPLIAALPFAMPLYAISSLLTPAINALGRPGLLTVNALVGLIIMPAAFLYGVREGEFGLVKAWLVGYPILFAITAQRSLRVIRLGWWTLAMAVLPALAASGVMAAAVWAMDRAFAHWPDGAQLGAMVAGGAIVYAATLWLGFPEARRGLLSLARR